MTTVTVLVPLKIKQWGGRKAIIAPGGAPLTQNEAVSGPVPTRGDPALVKALARAHRWRRMLEAGEHGNVRELAKAEKVNETYISRALRLTLLAPGMVEAILDGRQPAGITLPLLMQRMQIDWIVLRRMFGGSATLSATATAHEVARDEAAVAKSLDGG